ncbi:hypothetical protein EYF80_061062 [Liparis tanakae]|uniref:Uncharacterized protein n=1 Tax=Liparis tanakae TaxID=230148 RepID=A0A4Z2EJ47_9TELE|nr:hypothetical protein EYF80_061062 [Liparis tanakae]
MAVLTVAVGGVLSPVDVAQVIDGEEPLRAAEQLSDAHISSLHVVVVPGVALVSGAVHDGGELLWSAVTADHAHAAEQEDGVEVQSREQTPDPVLLHLGGTSALCSQQVFLREAGSEAVVAAESQSVPTEVSLTLPLLLGTELR